MSGAYQVQNAPILSVLCIDADEDTFHELRRKAWVLSGLLRWSRSASSPLDAMIALGRAASRILLFDVPECNLTEAWKALEGAGLSGKATIVSTLPANVRPRRTFKDTLPARVSADEALASLLPQSARATIKWAGSDDATWQARQRFKDQDLQLVLEKYFPGWAGTASFDVVDGGLSGDSLIRVSLNDYDDEYYLKFYKNRESFVREWDGHNRALDSKWLDGYAVGLGRIPSLGDTGTEQAEAFPIPPAVSCLCAAQVRTRLSRLYVDEDGDFVLQAYEEILKAMGTNQPELYSSGTLSITDDIWPVGENGPAESLLASLRSPDLRVKILSSLDGLRPYALSGFVTKEVWLAIDGEIRKLLSGWEPDALRHPCHVARGRVQGDANSRNFLFNGQDRSTAKDLQAVDLGGYKDTALRVFDLAQLEADLKIQLMATETSCGEFLDINTNRLACWMQEEGRCVDEALLYSGPPPRAPAEILKAYSVVGRIRKEAGKLSPKDGTGRAYLFCLLYWTMRKIRLVGVAPETKRLLACYSSYRILEKLKAIHER